jgi:hypothetical protein
MSSVLTDFAAIFVERASSPSLPLAGSLKTAGGVALDAEAAFRAACQGDESWYDGSCYRLSPLVV